MPRPPTASSGITVWRSASAIFSAWPEPSKITRPVFHESLRKEAVLSFYQCLSDKPYRLRFRDRRRLVPTSDDAHVNGLREFPPAPSPTEIPKMSTSSKL